MAAMLRRWLTRAAKRPLRCLSSSPMSKRLTPRKVLSGEVGRNRTVMRVSLSGAARACTMVCWFRFAAGRDWLWGGGGEAACFFFFLYVTWVKGSPPSLSSENQKPSSQGEEAGWDRFRSEGGLLLSSLSFPLLEKLGAGGVAEAGFCAVVFSCSLLFSAPLRSSLAAFWGLVLLVVAERFLACCGGVGALSEAVAALAGGLFACAQVSCVTGCLLSRSWPRASRAASGGPLFAFGAPSLFSGERGRHAAPCGAAAAGAGLLLARARSSIAPSVFFGAPGFRPAFASAAGVMLFVSPWFSWLRLSPCARCESA